MEYKPRIFDKLLARELAGMGAVLIDGPKWCGKTTTAEQIAKSTVYMNDSRRSSFYIQLAQMSPKTILEGDAPRLIDEWQIAPSLWDAIRFDVDHRDGDGFYILTGSSVPAEWNKNSHTGTGRIAEMQMYPMSLWESGDSTGKISLKEVFEGKAKPCEAEEIDIRDLAYLTCRGGWPKATLQDRDIALDRAFDYYKAVTERDIQHVDGVDRDVEKAKRIMRSYARFQGAQVTITKIAQDLQSGDAGEVSTKTIDDYIKALKKLFVIEDMPAWSPNLRSKTAIRTSDTRYFIDPSIAVAALGAGPEDLINDLESFGLLFETMCVRDLRVYASALNGTVYHYRDKSGLECDTIVHLRNGKYGLIEIKLGGQKLIDEGAESLKELASKIDDTRMNKPSFLMVLCGLAPYAFIRPDGVWVVPVNCLRP